MDRRQALLGIPALFALPSWMVKWLDGPTAPEDAGALATKPILDMNDPEVRKAFGEACRQIGIAHIELGKRIGTIVESAHL